MIAPVVHEYEVYLYISHPVLPTQLGLQLWMQISDHLKYPFQDTSFDNLCE